MDEKYLWNLGTVAGILSMTGDVVMTIYLHNVNYESTTPHFTYTHEYNTMRAGESNLML